MCVGSTPTAGTFRIPDKHNLPGFFLQKGILRVKCADEGRSRINSPFLASAPLKLELVIFLVSADPGPNENLFFLKITLCTIMRPNSH